MKIKVERPNFIKNKWISEINITGVKLDRLKDRNDRKEIKLYGISNKFEYDILLWFSEDYLIKSNSKKARGGTDFKVIYNDDSFDISFVFKRQIPELKEINNKKEYYTIIHNKINKNSGAMVQLKILNRDLRSIHPSLQIPKPEYCHKDVYTHRKFYSGGSCSPK